VSDVAIIANGGANIASLRFALDRLGASSHLTADPAELRCAPRVILPGVGAAGDAMGRLRALGLTQVIPALTQPVLGICLGMQLLFAGSEEDDTDCLGILPACVRRFPDRAGLPVPHMGWNRLQARGGDDALLEGLGDQPYVYFVHSYAAPVGPWTVATSDYGGEFSALVRQGNFHGSQFHPERSSRAGARLLQNFLELG
jgi:glutamine amidotransferase